MTVYLDIVFLENVCMNYIIIYATVLLLKLNNKPYRIFLGSIIGAIYAVLSVMEIQNIYNNIFLKIIVSVVIMYISAETNGFKSLIKSVLVFYLVSFTFGGIALALLYFIKPEDILMRNGIYIGTYPIKIVLLGGILGIILFSIFYSIIKNKYGKKKKLCDIEIGIEENIKTVKALIDSGNFLKEPITGVPVVVVETTQLFQLIPKEILGNIERIIAGDLKFLEQENTLGNKEQEAVAAKSKDSMITEKVKSSCVIQNKIKSACAIQNKVVTKSDYLEHALETNNLNKFISRFRLIPFNSLGKENGLLLGIKADYLKIIENEEYHHEKIENIIIGLYEKTLSKERNL